MLFADNPHDRQIEKLMSQIPNFKPRGHGIYIGTKHLTISDLSDTELISPMLFGVICNAMAIRRYGLGAIQFK